MDNDSYSVLSLFIAVVGVFTSIIAATKLFNITDFVSFMFYMIIMVLVLFAVLVIQCLIDNTGWIVC